MTDKPLHPYCKACGWRKGGLDSWDGKACKCGDWAPEMPQHGMEALNAALEQVTHAKDQSDG